MRVYPADNAGKNTVTGGPGGVLRRGAIVKIAFGRSQDGYVKIALLDGPAAGDGYACVKLAGVNFAQ